MEAAGIAAQLDLDGDGKVRPVLTFVGGPFCVVPYIMCDHVMSRCWLVLCSWWFVRCRSEPWWNTQRPRRARRTWRYGTLLTVAAGSWRRVRATCTPLTHVPCPALPRVLSCRVVLFCQVLEDVLEVKGILDGPHAHAPTAATATTSAATTSAPPAQTPAKH